MDALSEWRHDATTGRAIAVKRQALAPSEYRIQKHEKKSQTCPFCPGKEAMTPGEVLAYGRKEGAKPDSSGWSLRVVPNRYAAVSVEEPVFLQKDGLFERQSAFGYHEVIVEHIEHDLEIADFDLPDIERVIRAFVERWRVARDERRFRYAMIFKNYGAQAGASLEHTHSQFVTLPFVPARAADEFAGAARYAAQTGSCAWCDELLAAKERRLEVASNTAFTALCPYAARFPFEMHILPSVHAADFAALDTAGIAPLAAILKEALSRLKRLCDDPPFNLIFHSAPLDAPDSPGFHWHIEIIPKLTRTSAFEWGTGFYVNTTSPEESAARLRAVGSTIGARR